MARARPEDDICGTYAGVHRHRRRGEPKCDACKVAKREYSRSMRRAKGVREIGGTLEARFARNTVRDGECLVWTGGHHNAGWGVLFVDGGRRLAHRVAYEQVHGPLAEDRLLLHTCGRRDCVRLAHLTAVYKQHDATVENLRAVLLSRREVDAAGCWNYTGCLNGYGYGLIGAHLLTHRAAYESWRAPIPDGLHIDHLCRNRRCFNPEHLEPVTQQENSRRGAAARTTCPRDHEYTPENTHINPRGARICRTCDRERPRGDRRG